eukprot:TRINITY_DN5619_c0_g1_i1.p1 TRINITY_DN5619_c0_g1~~TRINITY_DN5619_c0_g1_i1.p1  ORF type:complete len:373 (-),score=61.62 TRINITY_DN5619_c0_g1_i1:141-1112(-)
MDDCPCTEDDIQSLQRFTSLTQLSLKNTRLTSTRCFPCMPRLEKLVLHNNQIVDGLEALTKLEVLRSLDLSNNPIRSLHEVFHLSSLRALQDLVLKDCLVTLVPDYITLIQAKMPQLEFLDGNNKDSLDWSQSRKTSDAWCKRACRKRPRTPAPELQYSLANRENWTCPLFRTSWTHKSQYLESDDESSCDMMEEETSSRTSAKRSSEGLSESPLSLKRRKLGDGKAEVLVDMNTDTDTATGASTGTGTGTKNNNNVISGNTEEDIIMMGEVVSNSGRSPAKCPRDSYGSSQDSSSFEESDDESTEEIDNSSDRDSDLVSFSS